MVWLCTCTCKCKLYCMIIYVCVPETPMWYRYNKCGTAGRFHNNAVFLPRLHAFSPVWEMFALPTLNKPTANPYSHSHFSTCRSLFAAVPVEDGINLKLGCIILPYSKMCLWWVNALSFSASFLLISRAQKGLKDPFVFIMDVSMAHLWKSLAYSEPLQKIFGKYGPVIIFLHTVATHSHA